MTRGPEIIIPGLIIPDAGLNKHDHNPESHGKCPFCRIILGKDKDALTFFRERGVVGFMSLEGHPLFVPDQHFEKSDLSRGIGVDASAEVTRAAFRLAPIIEEVYHSDGFNVVSNIGENAGQEIPHIHTHFIPRFPGDKGMKVVVRNLPPKPLYRAVASSIQTLYKATQAAQSYEAL